MAKPHAYEVGVGETTLTGQGGGIRRQGGNWPALRRLLIFCGSNGVLRAHCVARVDGGRGRCVPRVQ